ncbi:MULTISPECIES: DEAD/DEAH box helicase [Alteribacter]|uniref:DEAD/DEAH box helicase n=1 Tax=Alteribacter keqinensis TaxID=2483800 RepID=A0A3M7TX14_9BACI|nr:MULTISPECIES: SNF2-related protein [Alteribacter]MBM7097311.1 DEAD/DEAH box helicase [Alteribacter salitolerans]RNA68955.1 DEAD/DEAH box helicase [Alteribacter keqinensis]
MNTPELIFDEEWTSSFLERVEQNGPWANWQMYKMAIEAEKELIIDNFDGLRAPSHLPHLTIFPHQMEAAERVLTEMNGKAILADEVGLGKTIEAGLILKEYMIRGLVKKVLILVPASLVTQWCRELNEKFFIPAVEQRKHYVWDRCDVIVSSIDTAKRDPHRSTIFEQKYDMIIIDEAHKLKNKNTKNYQFVRQLKKKFCLLLTATPVQNKLSEVFHLISILKPGHLGNEEAFTKEFKDADQHEELRQIVQKVMIRNRRSDSDMDWPKRIVKTVEIDFSDEEKQLYDHVSALKNRWGNQYQWSLFPFTVLTLQRECCSSREAVYMTLKGLLSQEEMAPSLKAELERIMGIVEKITRHAKAEKALELIQSIDDKVIIFTEYRATQLYLQWYFAQHGIKAVPFRGGFKRSKKDWMKQLFKDRAQVLIATEAGGEGINLQFCHHMINYDLPWNPMRIEQRIGRIHRLGQEHDVHIYNFAVLNTVEDHILKTLYKKIGLFEEVIGKLDDILEKMREEELEAHISNILNHSESDGEIRIKLDNLTACIDSGEEDEQYAANGRA